MKEFEALVAFVQSLASDATKTAGGNKSAGIRLRAGMQEVKRLAQEVRESVLEVRPAASTPKVQKSVLEVRQDV